MHLFARENRRYAQFEQLRHQAGLAHAFSTRPHDVSARPDEPAQPRSARRGQMAADFGVDAARLRYCQQVHETRLALVHDTTPNGQLDGYDGVATTLINAPIMTFSADCPLILVYDAQRRALALVHASWRCTVASFVSAAVELMQREFGTRPQHILAGVGPSAGPCCYEVKDDVYSAAAPLPQRDALFAQRNGRMYFDLWAANRQQLEAAGVLSQNIEVAGLCTMCRTDLFYSFRREGAGCGHFGLMAALVESRA